MKKYFFLLLNLLIFSSSSFTQTEICTGNLGDNIFESGDFGSGLAANPTQPEGLFSSYRYIRGIVPGDGDFTITNHTRNLNGLYPTWLSIGDNSDDPNGYFMVVNADFTTGVFYEQTIEGLCENTLYVFSADVINMIKVGVSGHIMPNVSFLLDDEIKYTTGEIRQNEQWNTYGFTFTTGVGVTSMKLSLRNNAPGGIGNDLAIDNITFKPCGPIAEILPKDIANICEDGDPIEINATINGDQFGAGAFQWQQSFDEGMTWENIAAATTNRFQHTEKSAGFYYYRYLLASATENIENSKCRVNSNTKIVQVVPKLFDIERSICEGLSFVVGENSYNETGIYTDSLISSIGCDSIVTLNLTVVPDGPIAPVIIPTDPLCAGESSGAIDIPNIQQINPPYRIKMGERESASFVRFVELTAGSYDIFIEDAIGCTFQTTVELTDPTPFEISLGEDITADLGESIAINPSSNYTIRQFEWSPNQIGDCEDNCFNQMFFPVTSDTYTLKATSELGCEAIDSIFILVNPARKVFVPNVFSPNSDGHNDTFVIYAQQPNVQQILEVAIFDRWGTLLFQQKNIPMQTENNLWDGQYKGQLVERGAYLYYVKVQFLDGVEETISGTITVMY